MKFAAIICRRIRQPCPHIGRRMHPEGPRRHFLPSPDHRDRDEEQILRHEKDPERRCVRLIENINSKERLWDDRAAVSRVNKELEALDGHSRARVMARTDGIGYAIWADVREQHRDTLSQEISRAADASGALAEEARS